MARYVDGFLVPVPRKNMKKYKVMAKTSAKAWKKHGALEYVECMGDDVPHGKITSFPKSVKLKKGEVVMFSYAVYKSKSHRDAVMKKVMNDPVIQKMFDNMPFDGMRMIWGGFKTIVSA